MMTLLALLLTGCVLENDLGEKDKDPVGFDSATTADTDTDTVPTTIEECNGVDDDADGQIDEGFPDGDADGFADCMEGECPPTALPVGGLVPTNEDCAGISYTPDTVVADPWHARALWTFEGDSVQLPGYTPFIANLDDDNADGVVDRADIPDVLLSGSSVGVYALDGATGTFKWALPEPLMYTPLVADLDGDGLPEIVSVAVGFELVAYNTDLSVKWRSVIGVYPGSIYITAADLDGDGVAEVLLGDHVFAGDDGAPLFDLPTTFEYQPSTAVGDIDLDGDQEIFHRGSLYNSDGTLLWTGPIPPGASLSWALIVNADADDEGELVLVSDRIIVLDTDGTLLAESALFSLDAPFPGPPSAADFDGDGQMELAFPLYYEGPLAVYELDGTMNWQVDSPCCTFGSGVSGFDFDGDGAVEIIYPGDEGFWVYDGATGATLFEWTDHRSPTATEYTSVADVDADGDAEIVFITPSHNIAPASVTALTHDGEGWAPGGPTWSDYEFAQTNVTPDGRVPARPEPSWLGPKVYRARTAQDGTLDQPDLVASVVDVCVADCADGPVAVSFQVSNAGLWDAAPGVSLTVYAVDETSRRAVYTTTLDAIPAGMSLDAVTIELPLSDLGERGVEVVIDDDGTGLGRLTECDETNNGDDWLDGFCP